MKTLSMLALTAALAVSFTEAQAQRPGNKGDMRRDIKLKVGDTAPDFKLKMNHSNKEVQLSSFRGKKPVVLVFGSYT